MPQTQSGQTFSTMFCVCVCGKVGHQAKDCPTRKSGGPNAKPGGGALKILDGQVDLGCIYGGDDELQRLQQRREKNANFQPRTATLADYGIVVTTKHQKKKIVTSNSFDIFACDASSSDGETHESDADITVSRNEPPPADDARRPPFCNIKNDIGQGGKAKHHSAASATVREEEAQQNFVTQSTVSIAELTTEGSGVSEIKDEWPALPMKTLKTNAIEEDGDSQPITGDCAETRSGRGPGQGFGTGVLRTCESHIGRGPGPLPGTGELRTCAGSARKECKEGKVARDENEPNDNVENEKTPGVEEQWEIIDDEQTKSSDQQPRKTIDPILMSIINSTTQSKEERAMYIDLLSEVDVHSIMKQINEQRQQQNSVNLFDLSGDDIMLSDGTDFQGNWVEVEFEVALDSGAIVHVCHDDDTPGYVLQESAGSKRQQHFTVGDGGRLPNRGEKRLNLAAPKSGGGMGEILTVFQIANVTRPLMSVGRICDKGMKATFDSKCAIITDQNNREVCRFERKMEVCIQRT